MNVNKPIVMCRFYFFAIADSCVPLHGDTDFYFYADANYQCRLVLKLQNFIILKLFFHKKVSILYWLPIDISYI